MKDVLPANAHKTHEFVTEVARDCSAAEIITARDDHRAASVRQRTVISRLMPVYGYCFWSTHTARQTPGPADGIRTLK